MTLILLGCTRGALVKSHPGARLKDYCYMGHPLVGANVKVAGGARRCRECSNAYLRRYRKRKKQ